MGPAWSRDPILLTLTFSSPNLHKAATSVSAGSPLTREGAVPQGQGIPNRARFV